MEVSCPAIRKANPEHVQGGKCWQISHRAEVRVIFNKKNTFTEGFRMTIVTDLQEAHGVRWDMSWS